MIFVFHKARYYIWNESCAQQIFIQQMESYQTPERLDSISERLCPWFCLSHRSYLINGRHIINLDRHHAILSNEISIPVSRTCYENVKKTFAGCVWSEEFYTT
ncbi:LytTR family DNA-binding domain-containing protein [Anaerobutyricum soehngenii]|uniref:LytTR family transcriptional regulator DNA-binding domain-containing protein n=1 Tax=Anaerobutyricum soehngenii TaxID=105843 RepID=UPI001C11AB9F|nr:LytTR family transcriptional regulator [Anaerobutyricum soehngenii]